MVHLLSAAAVLLLTLVSVQANFLGRRMMPRRPLIGGIRPSILPGPLPIKVPLIKRGGPVIIRKGMRRGPGFRGRGGGFGSVAIGRGGSSKTLNKNGDVIVVVNDRVTGIGGGGGLGGGLGGLGRGMGGGIVGGMGGGLGALVDNGYENGALIGTGMGGLGGSGLGGIVIGGAGGAGGAGGMGGGAIVGGGVGGAVVGGGGAVIDDSVGGRGFRRFSENGYEENGYGFYDNGDRRRGGLTRTDNGFGSGHHYNVHDADTVIIGGRP